MTWQTITNNPTWQYQDNPAQPDSASPFYPLWTKQTNGIRTVGSGAGAYEVYTQVRRVGDSDTVNLGELNKTFWDNHSVA